MRHVEAVERAGAPRCECEALALQRHARRISPMDWTQQLGSLLQQYATGTADHSATERDFDHVAQNAPRETVAAGISEAFRSNQTPPFPDMLSQLFARSGGDQRATVLNTLVTTLGPAVLSRVMSRHGVSTANPIGQGPIMPEEADHVPPAAVEELAAQAQQQDPSVMDRISHFYADQPAIVKTLGGLALAVAMAKVAQTQSRG